jgi:ribosome-binding ATPase YchF (GTP1/OBG family)
MHETRGPLCQSLFDFASKENNLSIRLCGALEQEIASLQEEEKHLFLNEYNLFEQGLNKLIHAGFRLLGLETFFTGGPEEVRSWTIKNNTTAPKAAAEIHTDFERGFIKAEVFPYAKLDQLGSEKAVKEAGQIQLQGKNYVVQDGDCIFFHFNV